MASRQHPRRGPRSRSQTFRRRGQVVTAVLSAWVVVVSLLTPAAAFAADTAGLTIQKKVSSGSVIPGETLNWSIEVGCSVLTEECINAQLIDTIPDELIVGGAGTIAMTPPLNETGLAVIDVTGQVVTIDFDMPLSTPLGQVGLANETVTITIPVTVRTDLPYSAEPVIVQNVAEISADNATSKTATAQTAITIPLNVATTATKTFSPSTVLGVAGSGTTVTVGGTNTSNSPVDLFIIQDPQTPLAASGIFADTLRVDSLDAVVWPAGAESAVVSVWDASTLGWVPAAAVNAGDPLTLPAAVAADNIRGVRIAFFSSTPAMQTGETASFALDTTVRSQGSGNRSNTSTSFVSVHGSDATAAATRALTLQAANSSVSASKVIAPDRLSSVEYDEQDLTEATVTLTARNTGTVPLTSLTISEPTTPSSLDPSANPLAPAAPGGGDLRFQGLGAVTWPTGATAASVTYFYSDSTSETLATSTVNTLPAADAVKRVTGFQVTFTGASIPQNAAATVAFSVETNPEQTVSQVNLTNRIAVSGTPTVGTPVTATAQDDAIIYGERLALSTTKTITRNELIAQPGQQTTASLRTTVAAYPESSRPATRIIQYDPPAAETGLTEWYTYFDPTALVVTSVPGGASLTVEYRDSAGNWVSMGPTLTGLDDSGSPYTVPIPTDIRDSIHGVRLIWDSATGFVPGSSIESNLNFQLRSTLRDTPTPLPNADLDDTLQNCSSATGWIGDTGSSADASAASAAPCPIVDLRATDPGTGPGTGDLPLYKQFRTVGSNGTTVNSAEKDITSTRSSERTGVRLSWSTGGRTGVSEMTISDTAVASGSTNPGGYAKGMYDAFNLVRINAITASIDPYFVYDRVAIQAYNASTGTWETPSGISCTVAAPCTTFNGYTLNEAQQELYVGVRFIYTERPGRTGLVQQAGAGVAVSTGNSRGITLVYAIRDTLRTDASVPVVNGPQYNEPVRIDTEGDAHSVIRNDAHAHAVMSTGAITRTVADTIELRDGLLQLNVTKSWTGGPLPITGDPRPTSRVTLRTTNQTAQPATVSELTILEPNPETIPAENPFEHFDLTRIHSLTHPAGATALKIEARDGAGNLLLTASGSGSTGMNAARTTALGWSAAQLADVQSLYIHYEGRMAVNQYAQVQFDLTVRDTLRSSPAIPVGEGTVDNGTEGSVSDWRYDPDAAGSTPETPVFTNDTPDLSTLASSDRASIEIVESTIGVSADKTFTPSSQVEGDNDPIVMKLAGTPSGGERVRQLVLTDDRATFWNAFDFVSIVRSGGDAVTLPTFAPNVAASQLRVKTEVCVGGTWDAAQIAANPDATCAERGGTWTETNTTPGGVWKNQAQLRDAAGILPSGVSADEVTGVRFTIKRADDTQWEYPHAPTITIPLTVQRRADLRIGGPVPSEYPGNTAAPGEVTLGTTTNTVTADLTGIWGGTATASDDASYRFVHLTSSVQVSKLPTGVRSPGVQVPYELTIRNTGQLPILNPVITDDLPTDAMGAMLIFNPDAPTAFTISVTGGTVPSGSLAIAPGNYTESTSDVTITTTTDAIGPTKIVFTFPENTVIGVGQTVKVRIPLFFRPGLAHDTELDNVFDVTGDRILDACTAPSGSAAPAVMIADDRGCRTSADVRVALAPSLRAFISVQALDTPGVDFPGFDDPNSQFSGDTNEACRTAQDANGFSRPPCAPQTIPGQDSTWRLTVQNTGTTDVSRLVVATRLPTLGDETIVSHLVRNSRWIAQFNGSVSEQFGPDTTVEVFYTTMTEPCVGVLDNPSDAAACGTDPATGWAPLPSGSSAFDPAVVTGLQFVVDFPDTNRFSPGEYAFVDIGTTTVAELSVFEGGLESDPLAVNSLSVSGISPDAPITRISALDYSRALLGLATGAVTLEKQISGPAATAIPDGTVFSGDLVCTSLGEEFTREFEFSVTGGVLTPPSITFDNLPGGADCTVTESAASGQTTYTANTVTVDPLADPAALPAIELVNDYQFTRFEVRKTVTADAGAVVPTDFEFEAMCTFLGQTVDLNGPAPGTSLVFSLNDGDVQQVVDVPVNSECVVTETNARGADLTIVSGGTQSPGSVTEDQAGLAVTITRLQPQEDSTAPSVNWMEFDNRYDAGAVILVSKAFDGGAADQFGENASPGKSFTIHVVCTFENVTQFDGSLVLNAANGWSETVEDLIEGAECLFTETALNGADLVIFEPAVTSPTPDEATGFIVVPGINEAAEVTATNWYLTGAIEVTKTWVGDGVVKFGAVPGLEYEFTLTCTRDGVEVILPGGSTRTVDVDNPTASFDGIASGADCVLVETDSNGASSWRVLDGSGEEVADGAFSITVDPDAREGGQPVDNQEQSLGSLSVENTFLLAGVSVAKSVDVKREDGSESGPFVVELVCTLDDRPIEAAEPSVRPIMEGETVTWTELAAGADCVVMETDAGGAIATGYRVTDTTGELGARVEGTIAALPPLLPNPLEGDTPNHLVFINSYPLPVTGGSVDFGSVGLVALGGVGLVLLGTLALVWNPRRRELNPKPAR